MADSSSLDSSLLWILALTFSVAFLASLIPPHNTACVGWAACEDSAALQAFCVTQPLLLHTCSSQLGSMLSPEALLPSYAPFTQPYEGPGKRAETGREQGDVEGGKRQDPWRKDHRLWSIMNSSGRRLGWEVSDSHTRWRIVLCSSCILSSTGI